MRFVLPTLLQTILYLLQASNVIGSLLLLPVRVLLNLSVSTGKALATWITTVVSSVRKITQRFIRQIQRTWASLHSHVLSLFIKLRHTARSVVKRIQANWKRFKKSVSKKIAKSKKTNKHNKRAQQKKNRFTLFSPGHAAVARWSVVLTISVTAGIVASEHITSYVDALPNPTTLSDFKAPSATLIYDRNGVLLYSAYDSVYRVPVSLEDLPPLLVQATIQSEDARFYTHHGVDLQSIARAIVNNLKGEPTQGASTITQQLARTAFLTRERSLTRKIDEAVIALKIEQNFSKDEILELYFNTVPYGGVTVGVEAAAKHYFHKSVGELSPIEVLFLASVTPAPSTYSQQAIENPGDYDRIQLLTKQLVSTGIFDQVAADQIIAEQLSFAPRATYKRAPHVVDAVLEQLAEQAGANPSFTDGVIVTTTIDVSLQNQVQQLVLAEVIKNGGRYNFSNAAVVIADPSTGEIQAMVGSANYFDQAHGQVNVATAQRQLGSTLKLIPYALALESGMSPKSTIVDEAIQFPSYQNYKPRNYDGKFHGTVTLTEALGNSYNIPALKLANQLGVSNVATLGAKMGISEFAEIQKPVPLTLAIGGVETSLVNLTQAYQVVAHDGEKIPLHLIATVQNHNGDLLYAESKPAERVLQTQTAQQLQEMLSDPAARSAMFGRPAFFDFGTTKVALKTGTSNDLKDNVAVAFTDNVVVSVWTGNNSGEPMANVASGQTGATPIMHASTKLVLDAAKTDLLVSRTEK